MRQWGPLLGSSTRQPLHSELGHGPTFAGESRSAHKPRRASGGRAAGRKLTGKQQSQSLRGQLPCSLSLLLSRSSCCPPLISNSRTPSLLLALFPARTMWRTNECGHVGCGHCVQLITCAPRPAGPCAKARAGTRRSPGGETKTVMVPLLACGRLPNAAKSAS